ncbi:MAG TPA: hypothetical protein VKA50_10575 [Gammaproteobacteria bacterium]|nr:hypothetical protein [Gammaproteobacteria bacterium]
MHIEKQSDKTVTITLSAEEAQHVLAGLGEHAGELGDAGQPLAKALTDAGITPYQPPEHVRHEWP